MTKPLVTILYEDQLVRGTQPRDYRNLESVLGALRACDPTLVGAPTWTRAIEGKMLLDRDLALQAAARSDRSLRERLRKHMPSFGYLVATTHGVWEALPR